MRLLLIVLVAVLAGCTTTEGDRLIQRGGALSAVGADLNKGETLIEDGRDDIAKGRKRRSAAQALIEEGEDKVARGEALLADARRRREALGE